MPLVLKTAGRWWAWLLAWAALTAAGTLLHHWLWGGQRAGPLDTPSWLQSLGNLVHILIGGAWMILRAISRDWPTGSWSGPFAANALGWFIWLLGLWVALRIRTKLLRGPGAEGGSVVRVLGPANSSRRRFLVDGPCALAAIGGVGALVKGEFTDPWDLTLRRYRVPIRGLPPALDGLRAVQVSDTHLGPRIPAAFVRETVARVLALKPDLVLLTGDYIHNGAAFIAPAAALFEPFTRSGLPVVGVLGNHDWYGDGKAMSTALSAIGVRMVDNRRIYLNQRRQLVPDAPGEGALCIAGLGDLGMDWVDAATALGGLDPGMPRLVLAHQPDTAEVLCGTAQYRRYARRQRGFFPAPEDKGGRRIDLMLSGHTHGGQVRIPFVGTPLIPSLFGQKYAGGVVQGPEFPVCISRGVGMSILPVRLGVPPEIVEITLVRA